MPERKYSASDVYRYGFNGKENDNEIKGEGNQQDYGMRVYDPRIGKFLSVDPLTNDYPWYTPYQFAGNDVIRNIDLDGGEPQPKISGNEKEGDSQQTSTISYASLHNGAVVKRSTWYFHKGGLGTGKIENGIEQTTKTGWYTSEQYINVLSSTTAARELASASGYYSYGIGASSGRKELTNILSSGLNDNALNYFSAAAWKVASDKNSATSGYLKPSSFNIEDMIGLGIVAKQLLRTFSHKAFYSVQSIDDYVRLKSGGAPWPTGDKRAHLGQGLYAWGSKAEAKVYLNLLTSNDISFKPIIVKLTINKKDYKALNLFKVPSNDKSANLFLNNHSSLFGAGKPHGFNYIQRNTRIGIEHYFSPSAFKLFKVH